MSPNVLPFPVYIVSAGDIHADLLRASTGERWASIPAFTRTVKRNRVEIGMIRRQCTKDYKIVPIRRKVRELVGLTVAARRHMQSSSNGSASPSTK